MFPLILIDPGAGPGQQMSGFWAFCGFFFPRPGFLATKPAFLERIDLTRGGGPGKAPAQRERIIMAADNKPLMPKATAVWLVDNTALSFEQIADFCGLHPLEVKGI